MLSKNLLLESLIHSIQYTSNDVITNGVMCVDAIHQEDDSRWVLEIIKFKLQVQL